MTNMIVHFVFSTLVSRPTSLLASKSVCVLFYGLYTITQQSNTISIDQYLLFFGTDGSNSDLTIFILLHADIKITFYLCMKIYGGVEIAPHILNLGTRCEWSASCPACFTPGKETPSIY
jgi:hypothetical protein